MKTTTNIPRFTRRPGTAEGEWTIAFAVCVEDGSWLFRFIGRVVERIMGDAGQHTPPGENAVARFAAAALIESELCRVGIFRERLGHSGRFNASIYLFRVSDASAGLSVLADVAAKLRLVGSYAAGVRDESDGTFRTAQGIRFSKVISERLSPAALARELERTTNRTKRSGWRFLKWAAPWLERLHKKMTGKDIPPLSQ